jgi:hypothetical protein
MRNAEFGIKDALTAESIPQSAIRNLQSALEPADYLPDFQPLSSYSADFTVDAAYGECSSRSVE